MLLYFKRAKAHAQPGTSHTFEATLVLHVFVHEFCGQIDSKTKV